MTQIIVLLFFFVALAVAANTRLGADTRDGRDWTPRPGGSARG